MPPSRKSDPTRRPRRSRAVPPPAPPPTPAEWSALGSELAALGPYRIAVAMRAARAAAGGPGMEVEEEDAIAAWFVEECIDVAIARDGARAAASIWYVLSGDWHRDPYQARPPRCPSVAALPAPPIGYSRPGPHPGEREFIGGLRTAAAGYVRTAIAGASAAEIDELRDLMGEDDPVYLDGYRPWGQILTEDVPAAEMLDRARHTLTQRHLSNDQARRGVESWSVGFAELAREHMLPPVARIGAIAWFARVALREERAA